MLRPRSRAIPGIGLVLVLVTSCTASVDAPARATTEPVAGAVGFGDPLFPRAGNGG
jgi:hypothetical protein